MDALLTQLTDFVAANRVWAGAVLALLTLLEALLLIGVLIPIMAVMLMAGALIAQGALHPVEVILWCSFGAMAGDALSFLVGQHFGGRALRHRAFAKHKRSIARARLFSRRYGVVSIVVARYLGPLRPFVPMAVGMSRMRPLSFQAANIASAPLWVLTVLAPGYLAASNLDALTGDVWTVAGLAVAAVLAGLAFLALRRRRAPATALSPA